MDATIDRQVGNLAQWTRQLDATESAAAQPPTVRDETARGDDDSMLRQVSLRKDRLPE